MSLHPMRMCPTEEQTDLFFTLEGWNEETEGKKGKEKGQNEEKGRCWQFYETFWVSVASTLILTCWHTQKHQTKLKALDFMKYFVVQKIQPACAFEIGYGDYSHRHWLVTNTESLTWLGRRKERRLMSESLHLHSVEDTHSQWVLSSACVKHGLRIQTYYKKPEADVCALYLSAPPFLRLFPAVSPKDLEVYQT